MGRFRLSTDERALSPVIGTVLMIGITVTLMAMVGAVVLQGTPAEANSEMEVVYQEEHDGDNTLLQVGVASGEGELDLVAGNEDVCDWDGPMNVETGDTVTMTCSESDLPVADSVSVIHDGGQSEVVDEIDIEGNAPEFLTSLSTETSFQNGQYTIEATGQVENNGNAPGEQDVVLEVVDEKSETETVILDEGQTGYLDIEWEAPIGQADDQTVQIQSEDDSETSNIAFGEFVITDVETPDETFEGEPTEIEAEIENTGGETDVQDIEFEITNEGGNSDETVDTHHDLELGAGESESVTFEWEPAEENNERTYSSVVSTEDNHQPGNPIHVDTVPVPKFDSVTAEATEDHNPEPNDPPSVVEFEHDIESEPADIDIEFAVDVNKDGNTETESVTETDETVVIELDVDGHVDDYPAEVTATVGETECTATIDENDGVVDVC
ncbi:flagellin N-terminal-like domain-containing protein [Natronorubrum sediminis]|uniref:Flagellin N-terminal-like domain-containing protein n=1 Tax=Natronorubrum sediminis TaxID=640943 RepID=A0A1H6FZ06_9EURY|nr:type IV pilin N-terminal domain-containing protein [Natronorubrum sediminis]SEH14945.1 flagellin N-terminal-like domain-containing protein [Natronorubrum sediminis]